MNNIPIGFCDSDFAGDKATSKSTYGFIFKLAGGPIAWKSKKGSTICLSTLEAEYVALIEGIREVLWITDFYKEINNPLKNLILLYSDSKNAITIAHDPTNYS
jgi:hypothetical protein